MLSKNIFDVLIAPIYSEKATVQSELSKHTFKVAKNATKTSVKEAVEKLFSVKVIAVNMLNSKQKKKIFRGVAGTRQGYKKAIVTIEKGKMIEFSKGV
ncbi:MAG: rplW [Candidatus Midichloriaceae bacterium]|jgi:large subunit ribosomal protein L23|nr:rplW [Candidatus Midichloriaceae bacterium]